MIAFELTADERLQFQYILPAKGSIKTLEMVESILEKIKFMPGQGREGSVVIEFSNEEIDLMKMSISHLDKNQILPFPVLGLAKKILRS